MRLLFGFDVGGGSFTGPVALTSGCVREIDEDGVNDWEWIVRHPPTPFQLTGPQPVPQLGVASLTPGVPLHVADGDGCCPTSGTAGASVSLVQELYDSSGTYTGGGVSTWQPGGSDGRWETVILDTALPVQTDSDANFVGYGSFVAGDEDAWLTVTCFDGEGAARLIYQERLVPVGYAGRDPLAHGTNTGSTSAETCADLHVRAAARQRHGTVTFRPEHTERCRCPSSPAAQPKPRS